ncbi:hypothetical protein AU192_02685 [Mycobacterium lehmannii]|uniref:Uncharacterized protein n=1 Tax=Mycobacterium lehmannii TaxID=2048550 RepID=A0A101A939_9MYCO|nr:hypothetical protein AU192_02685 [Mycobacterium lehmannii]
MADTTYAGQLNVPDMFTRLVLSLVATGVAPFSFYEVDEGGNRQRTLRRASRRVHRRGHLDAWCTGRP